MLPQIPTPEFDSESFIFAELLPCPVAIATASNVSAVAIARDHDDPEHWLLSWLDRENMRVRRAWFAADEFTTLPVTIWEAA